MIGAGPAGALAAREVAAGGARVLLVEKRVFPRSKVCGACLNGRALGILDEVGLGSLATRSGGVALREFRLHFRGRWAHFALPIGIALSRDRLDAELVEAAIGLGGPIPFGNPCPGRGDQRHNPPGAPDMRRTRPGWSVREWCWPPQGWVVPACRRAAPLRVRIARGSWIGAGCRIHSRFIRV